ncbi:DNA glycosylase/AP lyase ROS1 [Linum grandiflorum]
MEWGGRNDVDGGAGTSRPIQQNPGLIYTDMQGNPLLQLQQPLSTNWPPPPANFQSGFMHAPATATDMERWRDIPFQCLMALTETASSIPTVPSWGGMALTETPSSIPTVPSWGGMALTETPSSIPTVPSWGGIDLNFDYGCQDPFAQQYDYNLPQGSMAEPSFSRTSFGFAPVTPQKPAAVESRHINGSLELAPVTTGEEVRVEVEQDLLCQETLNRADVVVIPDENDGRNQDSAPAASLTWANHNREKVDFSLIDLNKLPPQPPSRRKPKRKKHVPKVLVDGKPKKRKQPETTPKPPKKNGEKQGAPTEASNGRTTPFETHDANEGTPRNMRKYSRRGVRKTIPATDAAGGQAAYESVSTGNGFATAPPPEATGESADPQAPARPKRSCRKELHFDLEEPAGELHFDLEETAGESASISHGCGIEVKRQKTSAGSSYDFDSSIDEMVRSYSSKATTQAPPTPFKGIERAGTWSMQQDITATPQSAASSCISSRTLGKHSCPAESPTGFHIGLSLNQTLPWALVPVCRKKRTIKVQTSTVKGKPVRTATEKVIKSSARPVSPAAGKAISSTATASINYLTYAHCPGNGVPSYAQGGSSLRYKLHNFSPLYETEMSTKRRSRAPVRVRDLASLVSIPLTGQPPPACGNRHIQNLKRFDMRMEALVADGKATLDALVAGYKATSRSRKDSQTKYASSKVNDTRRQGIMVPLDQNRFLHPASGSLNILSAELFYVDALAEQLKHLHISSRRNPRIACAQRNQLVPYHAVKQKQNAMVIYTGDRKIVPFQPPKKKRPRAKVVIDEETLRVFNLLLQDIDSEGVDGTDPAKRKYWEEERRIFRGRADSFIARMHLVQGDRRFTRWKGSVVDSVVGVFLTQNVSDHLSSSAFMSMAAHFPIKSEQKTWDEGMHCIVVNPIVSMPDEETVNLDDMSNQSISGRSSITVNEPRIEEAEVAHTIGSTRSMSSDTDFLPGEEIYNEFVISSQNSTVSSQNSNSPVSQTVDRKDSSSETNSQELDPTDAVQANSLNVGTSFIELLHMAQSGSSMLHEVPRFLRQNLNETDKTSTMGIQTQKESVEALVPTDTPLEQLAGNMLQQKEQVANHSEKMFDIVESSSNSEKESVAEKTTASNLINHPNSRVKGVKDIDAVRRRAKSRRVGDEIKVADWEALRRSAEQNGIKKERAENAKDSVDWEAVRCADVNEIADTIKARGMNNMLAARIKEFLDKVLDYHGSVDLEWLRDVPPDRAKDYLLNFNGLGLKSVECVRLLTLHHLAFPVDTNVGRIAVRLGWVPLEPLPESLQLHLLEMYPILDTIQKYLWPRLCKLDQKTLYELHYQLITFGKVFCTKSKPNCNACPMRGECRHFASAFASARLSLPGPEEKRIVSATQERPPFPRPMMPNAQRCLPPPTICEQPNQPMLSLMPSSSSATEQEKQQSMSSLPMPEQEILQSRSSSYVPQQENHPSVVLQPPEVNSRVNHEPIIEEPLSPQPEFTLPDIEDFGLPAIEDAFYEDPDEEIPVIKLNVEELAQNIETYIKQQNLDLRESDMSLDLVAMATEATYIPPPKLKNISRLRTEHQVYELPDRHPLLEKLDRREYDDPSPYLLAIWTPGETADSVSPSERKCTSQLEGRLCDEGTCPSCDSYLQARRQIVRGTILIPCRTAMRGSFPLNGTYFQVNEVFADHESSMKPIEVSRALIWNLPRRTVYFGTSVPTIFRGLTTEQIQHCFWRGFVCVRGFERETRAPRPLMARLHFPASKLKPKGKNVADDD